MPGKKSCVLTLIPWFHATSLCSNLVSYFKLLEKELGLVSGKFTALEEGVAESEVIPSLQ